jgi:L-lysine exporter family protein LysE/ArgO
MTESLAAATTGFALGLTLIIAIGAQNAFVLRQGLKREHVGLVVAFCAGADALLMAAGVAGLGTVIGRQPALAAAMAAAGALFLAAYGSRALWRALRPGALDPAAALPSMSRRQALAQVAAFTLLNPHVYLDTVLLVGAVGAQHAGPARLWFVAGSAGASVLWFSSLGYGARLLAPVFARPRAWQWLDGAIGVTMWVLALLLLRHAIGASGG